MEKKRKGFSTEAIHGSTVKDQYGALVTPIYNTSTFVFDSTAQGAARFAQEEEGYIYSRLGTPTCTALEETLAKLEGGEAALVTATGMGAVTATIWTCISAGQEIIADKTLYGCTFEFFEHHLSRFGVKVHFIEMADEEELKATLNENTRIVYLETPANPNLKIIDIENHPFVHRFCLSDGFSDLLRIRAAVENDNICGQNGFCPAIFIEDLAHRIPRCPQLFLLVQHAVPVGMRRLFRGTSVDEQHVCHGSDRCAVFMILRLALEDNPIHSGFDHPPESIVPPCLQQLICPS